jgi:hypothetical protein
VGQPLTDAILLMRYLFGFRGEALVEDAVGMGCDRCEADKIEAFIQQILAGE